MYQIGDKVRLKFKIINGQYDSGEIIDIDTVTAQKTQYLLILERGENYKKLHWIYEDWISGPLFEQLEMFPK